VRYGERHVIKASKKGGTEDEVISSFGAEWNRFDQRDGIAPAELARYFHKYFGLALKTHPLKQNSRIVDYGAGSGRWAHFFVRSNYQVDMIEPSSSAELLLTRYHEFPSASVFRRTILDHYAPEAYDFSYSLGVLHHTLCLEDSLARIVVNSKKGGVVLLYLYYELDFRASPVKYVVLASVTFCRWIISRLPTRAKFLVCDLIALLIYLPLAKIHKLSRKIGLGRVMDIILPLGFYSDSSIYTLRTDSLDRFGTSIERRFSKEKIVNLMESAGLSDITFSSESPYWTVFGVKK
jgi:Methyltransferase domain